MDIGLVVALFLFIVHIVAFVAGGANSVVMPIIGSKMASATPEVRRDLMDIPSASRPWARWRCSP